MRQLIYGIFFLCEFKVDCQYYVSDKIPYDIENTIQMQPVEPFDPAIIPLPVAVKKTYDVHLKKLSVSYHEEILLVERMARAARRIQGKPHHLFRPHLQQRVKAHAAFAHKSIA